jgi:two-component system, NarL family, sensor histidine kinase UhpB
VREALNELRLTVGRLFEPIEFELNLAQALQRLATSFEAASNIQIKLDIPDEIAAIDNDQHLVLYRTAQEALTNIQRHAHANQVWIQLEHQNNNIQLIIKDDGVGFSIDEQHDGFGLRGLRERARMIGGSLKIVTIPGQGTTLKLTIPFR